MIKGLRQNECMGLPEKASVPGVDRAREGNVKGDEAQRVGVRRHSI